MTTAKRLFYYVLSLASLALLASGAGIILTQLFDLIVPDTTVPIRNGGLSVEQLSLGIASLVIGAALWWFFWRLIRRSVLSDPYEIGAAVRKLYLNLILLVTSLSALTAAVDFTVWCLGGFQANMFPSGRLAALIVTAALWYFHWNVSEEEGQPSKSAVTLRRWYVYILAAWGLVTMTAGLVQFINQLITSLPVWRPVIIDSGFWDYDLQSSLAMALFGAFAWGFHWLFMARNDRDSTLRQVYLYLLAISVSAIAGLVALTTLIFRLLQFMFGSSTVEGAAFFEFTGWAVPLLVVSLAIWLYHERVTQDESGGIRVRRLSARRIHIYLMSFIALGALVGGLITLGGVLLDIPLNQIETSLAVSSNWWHQPLSLSLALLVVSTPLWLYYWKQALVMLEKDRPAESRARSRRIFIYIILGASIITLAADLVIIIYQLLNGLLQGESAAAMLRGIRWALQTLVVALPLLLYFWRTLKQDQQAGAEALPRSKAVSILIPEKAGNIASDMEEALGYGIKELRALVGLPAEYISPPPEEIKKLAEEIRLSEAPRILLLLCAGKWTVIPYTE